jgi:hypothetical protein
LLKVPVDPNLCRAFNVDREGKILNEMMRFGAFTNSLIRVMQGGHFAALERAEDMKKDITDFVEQVWPGIKREMKELPLR